MKTTKKKLVSLPKLKKKAWKLISLYVRSNGSQEGFNECFTCYKWCSWKYDLQAGHYIHGKLDFDLRNLKPQCVQCNHYKSGNLGVYAERLLKEYGQNWIDQLRAKAQVKGNYYTRIELNEIIEKYK